MYRRDCQRHYTDDEYSNRTRIVFATLSVIVVIFLFGFYRNTDFSSSRGDLAGLAFSQIYSGYAVPISSINVDTALIFNNLTDTVSRSFDVNDDILYRRAYVSYDGQSWTPFNLTPIGTISGEWIYGSGSASVSFTPTKLNLNSARTVSNNTYLIIYSCSKNTTIHDWSCHDGWQIIKFDARLNSVSSNNYLYVDYLNNLSATAGDNDYFIVTSNTAWAISSSPSWVTLSKNSGIGNDTITVFVNENTGSQRLGIITLTGVNVQPVSLSFIQYAGASTMCTSTQPSTNCNIQNGVGARTVTCQDGSWITGTCIIQSCNYGYHIVGNACVKNTTSPMPSCTDGIWSGDEDGVDCGGSCPTACTAGNTYYLSPSGNDLTGNGSITNPWYTLEKAWSFVKPGDIIYMRDGTYKYDAQHLLDVSGTSNNIIRVWAFQHEHPIITRNDATFVSGWPNALIYFRGDHVHFKGLEIMGNTQKDSEMWPGMRVENSNYNTFELLNIHDNGEGMAIVNQGYTAHSTGNLVLNCDFHHNQDPLTSSPYDNADGLLFMSITHPEDVNTIRGCRSWWNTDDGYDFDSNEGMLYVENSWAWYNGYIPDTFDTTEGGDGNGFKLGLAADDALDQRKIIKRRVINCLAFDNMAWGFHENGALENMELYSNIAYNNGIQDTWSGGFHLNVANTPYYVKNNIAYKNVPTSVDLDVLANVRYNSWDTSGILVNDTDFLSVDSTGVDGARLENGSLPALKFLHLNSNSDLIDKGVDVGLSYNGNAPDLGAYEYPN